MKYNEDLISCGFCVEVRFRSSVDVGEAGIDAGGLKLEAGIPKNIKGIFEQRASKDKLRYQHR